MFEKPMTRTAPSASRWSTASADDAPDTTPMELSALGQHVERCNVSRGPLFSLRCAADSLAGFLAPRLVTTFVAVGLFFSIASLIV